MKLLVRGAQIITQNAHREVITGDILIDNESIAAIGKLDVSPEQVDRIIEAAGKTIIPGLIQTHLHLTQTLFRGQADDLELMEWLKQRVWKLEAAHDAQSNYWSAALGITELIQGGTTAIVDMATVNYTESVFEAVARSGLRALTGKVMMNCGEDVPAALMETTQNSVEQSVQLLEKWHGYDGGRIQYAFCPRFVVSCTEDLLLQVRDLSAHYNVMVHTHASENREEIALVEQERGWRNVTYLDKIGLANERLILAHAIWLDEEEKQLLAQRGVKVSHCISSNLKLASGIAPVPELLELGVTLGLGADGAPCNNNLDMFTEMRTAALIQKVRHNATTLPAQTVFDMATLGGAATMRLEHEIGSIEVGKRADIVLLNLNQAHSFPSVGVDPVSRVVYSAKSSDVETVIINGKVVLDNKKLLTLDVPQVLKEADHAVKGALQRAGLGNRLPK